MIGLVRSVLHQGTFYTATPLQSIGQYISQVRTPYDAMMWRTQKMKLDHPGHCQFLEGP